MSQDTDSPAALRGAAKSTATEGTAQPNETGWVILMNWILMVLGLGAIIALASLLSDYL